MRRWLHQNGFTIDAGQLVEDHHYYQTFSIHKESSDMRGDQYLFGVYLDWYPLSEEYWIYILEEQKIIMQHTRPHHDGYATAVEKIKTIEKKLKELD